MALVDPDFIGAAMEFLEGSGMARGSMAHQLIREMTRQDAMHPRGYPPTRDGIRLGLAAAQDELNEALDAWRADRCKCEEPECGHYDWQATRGEIVQTIGVLLRCVRSIDGHTPKEGRVAP